MKKARPLSLEKINTRREDLHAVLHSISIEKGWIREVREALGMTLGKLGESCGLALSTVAQAERGEVDGKITVETLRKTAEAMNCEFAYVFIPKSDLNSFIESKAYEKAKRILTSADLHMTLEDQKVKSDLEPRIQRLKNKLISEGKVW